MCSYQRDFRCFHLLDGLLDIGVLLQELLVQCGPGEGGGAWGGAGIRMVRTGVLDWDGLTLQHPRMSSWWPCHHVASDLLLLWRRSSLQYHGGGWRLVDGGVVAGVWRRGSALVRLLLPQSHVTELGVEGTRLETQIDAYLFTTVKKVHTT